MAKENNKNAIENNTFWGSLTDIGLSEYEVEWQRISSMQQSAGILVATLTIIYSGVFLFFSHYSTLMSDGNVNSYQTFLSALVFFDLFFAIITTIFLFLVIWPKKVNGLPTPISIDEQIHHNELGINLYDTIKMISQSIDNIHSHVEKKQVYYTKGLTSCIYAFILTALILILLLNEQSNVDVLIYIGYILLLISSLLFLYLIFIKRDKKND